MCTIEHYIKYYVFVFFCKVKAIQLLYFVSLILDIQDILLDQSIQTLFNSNELKLRGSK